MLQVIDLINSLFQAVVFSISIFYCINDKINDYIKKIIISTILLFVAGSFFTSIFGNLSVCVFIVHILSIAIVLLVYRNKKQEAIIGYSIVYTLISLLVIICNNVFYGLSFKFHNLNTLNYFKIIIIYVSQMLLMFAIVLGKKYIKIFYRLIDNEIKNKISLVIIPFILDWIIAFNLIIYRDESGLKKNITIIIICTVFMVLVSYFAKIKQTSDEVFKLNEALDEKNKELRKIKHDYGAQISYLYGLHLMKRFDELGIALKNIINNNNAVDSAVTINEGNNILLSLATQGALDQGIHVIINDKCSLKKIDMEEMELYRIIKNIVNNAVRAMNGEGVIKIDTFEMLSTINVKISNNGPKIPQENLEKIFEAGFTTKENLDGGHGFGLSIVKELVESHNGTISVKSTDKETEFKLVFPIKNN